MTKIEGDGDIVKKDISDFHDRLDKSESIKEYKDYSLHTFTEKEYDDNYKFKNKHYKKCGNGNRYVYELIGTGLGEVIKITCPICGKCKDITDIEKF